MGEGANEIGAVDSLETARRGHPDQVGTGPLDSVTGEEDVEAARLRAEIEHTRSEMSGTLQALQERLAPERVVAEVKEQVKEQAVEAFDTAKQAVRDATVGKAEKMLENVSDTVGEVTRKAGTMMGGTGSSVMNQMRENPLAYGLIGIGLGMLLANGKGKRSGSWNQANSSERDDYVRLSGAAGAPASMKPSTMERAREAAGGVAASVQEKVSTVGETIRETASTVVDRTREQVDYLGDQARHKAQRVSSGFDTMLRDNPLGAGAIALVAGAAVGLVLPSTQVESEYMGETRAQLLDKAQAVAKDTAEKIQHVAEQAGRTLKEEAQHQGLPVGS